MKGKREGSGKENGAENRKRKGGKDSNEVVYSAIKS